MFSRREISYDIEIKRVPSDLRCQGGNIRIQARLFWSHESFSLEKKPTTCRARLGGFVVFICDAEDVCTRR